MDRELTLAEQVLAIVRAGGQPKNDEAVACANQMVRDGDLALENGVYFVPGTDYVPAEKMTLQQRWQHETFGKGAVAAPEAAVVTEAEPEPEGEEAEEEEDDSVASAPKRKKKRK